LAFATFLVWRGGGFALAALALVFLGAYDSYPNYFKHQFTRQLLI